VNWKGGIATETQGKKERQEFLSSLGRGAYSPGQSAEGCHDSAILRRGGEGDQFRGSLAVGDTLGGPRNLRRGEKRFTY